MAQVERQQNQSKLFIADIFLKMKTDALGGFLGSAPYGDYCKFIGQSVVNPKTRAIQFDSLYNLSTEFLLSDFYTLQMLGLVTTKSNLMVAMLFPKVNYKMNSKT